jgi:hypothetical protein
MQRIALLMVLGALLAPFDAAAGQPPSPADAAVFVAYYWRARPGKVDEYSDYIKHTKVGRFRLPSHRRAKIVIPAWPA